MNYELIKEAVEGWLKEKEDYDQRKNRILGIEPKVYFIVFALLFLYAFLLKDWLGW